MRYFAIYEREIILKNNLQPLTIDDINILKSTLPHLPIIVDEQNQFQVLPLNSITNVPNQYKVILLRTFFHTHSEEESFYAFRARAISNWHNETKYCHSCGHKLVLSNSIFSKECPTCNNIIFPRIDPCIIVLIKKNDQMLLVRHKNRNQDIFACIAGFVEAGESIENAVHREVKEEVGINIKNLKYKGSQSWPFPGQLMLGFTAEYESGDIRIQEDEITEAKWFYKNECPALPPEGSIAYRLIHDLF